MFKTRQLLGKYRIERKLADGGFASVFQAFDTIEGIHVALKVPHAGHVTDKTLSDFRREVRLLSRLEHPNILSLKDASFIDGHFVIVYPLGERTLSDRLRSRMSIANILDLTDQMLDAAAYAHSEKIIHCDIKPENMLLFPGHTLKLTDFGIAKIAQKTVRGAGTGTIGYMAPEQAMGKPSFRSDVFSLGLIVYRMISGVWPEYPYDWPGPGISRVRKRVTPEFVDFLKRSTDPRPRGRYRDALQMQNVFRRVRGGVFKKNQTKFTPGKTSMRARAA
ncbi:MAG: serine/threonine protein kinase [Rubinisphaera brasiliensis]|uniref:serine/threonine protein kinase n=1 Tax=Rubinisphaera brasiliensis TaxID=119 RepID=UPI000C442902|nr:protein kinase [Planctomyces sp.]MBR9800985.1 serine/threonine protein kinase [bacterium]